VNDQSDSAPPDIDNLHAAPDSAQHTGRGVRRNAALTLAALGVVFGDIGTSPLYALHTAAVAAGRHVPVQSAIMGVVSLIVWSLIVVVTLKYVMLIMRADNDGEGGVLALASLAHRTAKTGRHLKIAIGTAAIFGLALFIGDGILTPAISVLSAVEGLSAESKELEPLVLPMVLVILIGLFAIQSRGTATVGKLFGPIMVLWFVTIGILGLRAILVAPQILYALSPTYGLMLFLEEPWTAFVTLGAVVLAVTGCEALYADMGHFGKRPINFAWLFLVFPTLMLNYFGQGAVVLRDPSKAEESFYALAPHGTHYAFVLLATVATVIASQAVISGVYSITRQAVQLGQLPRMEIRHTSATEYGQIYVPKMNAFLCLGVVLTVLIFRTSDALAAAYGIAVTGVMALSTALVGLVALRQWRWKPAVVYAVFGGLAFIDLAFLSSNALKITEGGWLPLVIATFVYIVMETWRTGRRAQLERIQRVSVPLTTFIENLGRSIVRVSGTGVFLTARADAVPGALLHNLKHNKMLHERVLIVQVTVGDKPFVPAAHRVSVENLGKGFFSVFVRYGFFQIPDLPRALAEARGHGLVIDHDTTTYFVGRETLVPAETPALSRWRMWLYTQLAANAQSPAQYYRLTPNRVVELGTQVSI
jgi:KUP system potassium uptake protein